MFETVRNQIKTVNESKLLMGVVMLLLNIGSKYIELGFSKTQEQALKSGLAREILIFAIIFTGTHDLIISILMTAAFIILSDYLFNESSKFCIIPERLKKISLLIDKNKDNIISPEEEKKAIEILKKADKQKTIYNQAKFTSYLNMYKS